jgi:hypothetical protein
MDDQRCSVKALLKNGVPADAPNNDVDSIERGMSG